MQRIKERSLKIWKYFLTTKFRVTQAITTAYNSARVETPAKVDTNEMHNLDDVEKE